MFGPYGCFRIKDGVGQIICLAGQTPEFLLETFIGRAVHLGIWAGIDDKFKLSHDEHERLIDLTCQALFLDLVPNYEMRQFEDHRIDEFANELAIQQDLPGAIAKFVETYPR